MLPAAGLADFAAALGAALAAGAGAAAANSLKLRTLYSLPSESRYALRSADEMKLVLSEAAGWKAINSVASKLSKSESTTT